MSLKRLIMGGTPLGAASAAGGAAAALTPASTVSQLYYDADSGG